eukprot:superscaffoldBa00002509_g14509
MDTQDGNQDSSQQRLQAAASFKAFMLKNSTKSNLDLYDHLTQLLIKVMDEHPQNVVDVIEDMSYDVKRGLFEDKWSTLRDLPQTTAAERLAEHQRLLFSRPEEADHEEELVETPLPNVSEIGFYMEQAGVGLGREEMQRVFLALKQLVESQALQRCRLWGKILGTESSYIIAEAEYREGEEEEEQNAEEAAKEEEREAETHENERKPQLWREVWIQSKWFADRPWMRLLYPQYDTFLECYLQSSPAPSSEVPSSTESPLPSTAESPLPNTTKSPLLSATKTQPLVPSCQLKHQP